MGDLREQLLKAKLIDESQARKAKQAKRKQRKERGTRKMEAANQEKQDAYRAKQAKDSAMAREQEKQRRQKEAGETRQIRLIQIIESGKLKNTNRGSIKFYFIARNDVIPCLEISSPCADALRNGSAAIVQSPRCDREIFSVVNRETACKIQTEAPELVRFFNHR